MGISLPSAHLQAQLGAHRAEALKDWKLGLWQWQLSAVLHLIIGLAYVQEKTQYQEALSHQTILDQHQA